MLRPFSLTLRANASLESFSPCLGSMITYACRRGVSGLFVSRAACQLLAAQRRARTFHVHGGPTGRGPEDHAVSGRWRGAGPPFTSHYHRRMCDRRGRALPLDELPFPRIQAICRLGPRAGSLSGGFGGCWIRLRRGPGPKTYSMCARLPARMRLAEACRVSRLPSTGQKKRAATRQGCWEQRTREYLASRTEPVYPVSTSRHRRSWLIGFLWLPQGIAAGPVDRADRFDQALDVPGMTSFRRGRLRAPTGEDA